MRPIVHIGFHKTATTWFQEGLYPAATSHAPFSRAQVRAALVTPEAFHFDPCKARGQLTPACGRPPLLCEETLSGYLHNGGLGGHLSKAVAERIHTTFPNAHIVIFVRRQPGMIAAVYQQYVRGGGTYRPHRYLFPHARLRGAFAEPDKVPRFSFAHFEYDRLIAHYDALFGAENVHVLPYEELCRDRDAVIGRLARLTGLALDPARISAARRNASYARPLVPLARAANHFTRRTVLDKRTFLHVPGWYHVRRRILEGLNATGLFGRAPSPEQLLGADIAAFVRRHYVDSNRRLAALRPALPLAALGYPLERDETPAAARAPATGWAQVVGERALAARRLWRHASPSPN